MTNNKKFSTALGISAFVLGSALSVSAYGQTATSSDQVAPTPASATSGSMSPDDKSTYATGKPLEQQSKEGFWGHVNPFARKKWVNRQTAPLKDRANELDQLQAKNANDIRDVDTRSQAGINKAMTAAQLADQHAQDAATRAGAANQLAGSASDRTTTLNGTVANLDQYQTVASTDVKFVSGRTTLGKTAKADLDDVATKLEGEKGYIIEVQGYSRSGVQTSQAMADSVVRYLVTEHQVPVFRIYKTGLGKNTAKAGDGEKLIVNGVRVTLLHNSLATMGTTNAPSASSSTSRNSAPTPTTGVSAPPAN
jgi:outer membrane protein OmpA-like peptidoglycan-associated protein